MRFLKSLLKAAAISFALFATGIVLAAVIYPDTAPPDSYSFAVVLVPFAVFIFILTKNKPHSIKENFPAPSPEAQHTEPAFTPSPDSPNAVEETLQREPCNTSFSGAAFSGGFDSQFYLNGARPDEDVSHDDDFIIEYSDHFEISIVTDGPEQIVTDGYYDFTRFSLQEAEKIKSVLDSVKRNYPPEHYAIGLVESSFGALYKPGYILNEIVVQLYRDSSIPHDCLSVALAYATKGAAFRNLSIEYFERAYPFMDSHLIGLFSRFSPETIYFTFAKLYEKEHKYQTAYTLLSFGCMYLGPEDKENLNGWFLDLSKKITNPPRHRRWSPPEDQILREKQTEMAAKYFISLYWNSQ